MQAIADIAAEPEPGQTRWKVSSRWAGGTRSDHFVYGVQTGGQYVELRFQNHIDEPCELYGTNQFANPQEYLRAATNECMLVGYATVAAAMGVTLTRLELKITGDFDVRGFPDIDGNIVPDYDWERLNVGDSFDGLALRRRIMPS